MLWRQQQQVIAVASMKKIEMESQVATAILVDGLKAFSIISSSESSDSFLTSFSIRMVVLKWKMESFVLEILYPVGFGKVRRGV